MKKVLLVVFILVIGLMSVGCMENDTVTYEGDMGFPMIVERNNTFSNVLPQKINE